MASNDIRAEARAEVMNAGTSCATFAGGFMLLASAMTLVLGTSAASAQDAPTMALPKNCEQAATERIGAMGLANTVKRGMSSEVRNGTNIPSGYRARYFNPDCNGYVVMNFDSMCGFEHAYTTGGCRMQGMARW